METGAYGSEVSWELDTSCTSDQVYSSDSEITKTCALSPGEYTLICTDAFGDGWNGGQITIQGVNYCNDFNYGSEKMVQVIITDGSGIIRDVSGMSIKGNVSACKRQCLVLFHTLLISCIII